jgi:hypothetical protein
VQQRCSRWVAIPSRERAVRAAKLVTAILLPVDVLILFVVPVSSGLLRLAVLASLPCLLGALTLVLWRRRWWRIVPSAVVVALDE